MTINFQGNGGIGTWLELRGLISALILQHVGQEERLDLGSDEKRFLAFMVSKFIPLKIGSSEDLARVSSDRKRIEELRCDLWEKGSDHCKENPPNLEKAERVGALFDGLTVILEKLQRPIAPRNTSEFEIIRHAYSLMQESKNTQGADLIRALYANIIGETTLI